MRRQSPGQNGRVLFVSMLLATATVLAAVSSRPLWLVVTLGVATIVSGVAGALLRPDREAADSVDTPRR